VITIVADRDRERFVRKVVSKIGVLDLEMDGGIGGRKGGEVVGGRERGTKFAHDFGENSFFLVMTV